VKKGVDFPYRGVSMPDFYRFLSLKTANSGLSGANYYIDLSVENVDLSRFRAYYKTI